MIQVSDLFDYYLEQIDDCEDLAELDALMFEACDDPCLTHKEFIRLVAYSKVVIDTRSWLS